MCYEIHERVSWERYKRGTGVTNESVCRKWRERMQECSETIEREEMGGESEIHGNGP